MTFLNPQLLSKSFRYAVRGVLNAWRTEQNFRLQSIVALGVFGLMLLVPLERWEIVSLILVITLVLVLELLNTMIEKLADLLEPRIHAYVKVIKDLMAALVLLASLGAAAVGLIVFLPHLI
jgi:diacylglycerol kinase